MALQVREAVLHCVDKPPSAWQMKKVFDFISPALPWDWTESGMVLSTSLAESIGHVPAGQRRALILALLHSFRGYASFGEQIFMIYRCLKELGFGFDWPDVCFLAFHCSRGLASERHHATDRILKIINSEYPRKVIFAPLDACPPVGRLPPGHRFWPKEWDTRAEGYRDYFLPKKRSKETAMINPAPSKRQKVRPPRSSYLPDSKPETQGQGVPDKVRGGVSHRGGYGRSGKSTKGKFSRGPKGPTASGSPTDLRSA